MPFTVTVDHGNEKAAQQMGLQLKTFTSLDEALDWVKL